MKHNKTFIATALTTALGLGSVATADAALINASWSGLFTLLDSQGVPFTNTSKSYYYDATWGYGKRTQVSGTLTFDTSTGAGSATVNPFQFMNSGPWTTNSLTLQAVGDGVGGTGSLVAGKWLYDWNSNSNINAGFIFDATGFFGAEPYATGQSIVGIGATPASNDVQSGKYPIGPAPIATTAWDTDYHNDPSCVMTASCLIADGTGYGGDPLDNGPYPGASNNIDITSIHIDSVENNAVPIPGAALLFGSGLLGMVGVARRRKNL